MGDKRERKKPVATQPKKVGHPTDYIPDFHPENFIKWSKQGKNITQISAIWDINRDTIYEWAKIHPEFSDAVKRGKQLCEVWYTNIGQSAMLGQNTKVNGEKVNVNLGFYVWMTKNICKWSDKVDTKSEISGTDGGPITFSEIVRELEQKKKASDPADQ